jgi:uncharacterized membrane protein
MKKQLLLILSLCFCLSGFAAGYRNTYWGESLTELVNSSNARFIMDKYADYNLCVENARMLGQSTTVYYVISKGKLAGICYTVDQTEEAQEMLDDLFSEKKLRIKKHKKIGFVEEYLEKFKTETDKLGFDLSILLFEDVDHYNLGGDSITGEYLRVDDEKYQDNYNVQVIKADYNNDTEVHIYIGLYPGKIAVVYTEKPQDF